MAKSSKSSPQQKYIKREPVQKKTSIGMSKLSRPTNKRKRSSWKAYRGQGK